MPDVNELVRITLASIEREAQTSWSRPQYSLILRVYIKAVPKGSGYSIDTSIWNPSFPFANYVLNEDWGLATKFPDSEGVWMTRCLGPKKFVVDPFTSLEKVVESEIQEVSSLLRRALRENSSPESMAILSSYTIEDLRS